jgi:hypothetical protein
LVHSSDIGLDDSIAVLNPVRRIGRLEAGEARAIEFAEFYSGKAHEELSQSIRQFVFAVGLHGHDDRPGASRGRPEQIGEEAHAVAHRRRNISLEDHRCSVRFLSQTQHGSECGVGKGQSKRAYGKRTPEF